MTLYSYLTKIKFLKGNFDNLTDVDKSRICYSILNFNKTHINNGVFGDNIFVKELGNEYFLFISNSKNKNLYYSCLVNEINISALKFEFLNYKNFELYKEFVYKKDNYLFVSFRDRTKTSDIMPAPISKVYRFDLNNLKTFMNYYEGWEYFEEFDKENK